MSNYSDSPIDFKFILADNVAENSRRNIGIFFMWLSGLGIPEAFHEFVATVFRTGNWHNTEEDEITLMRMARAISPGTDANRSILRAYERLKKSSLRFFEWQGQQQFEVIGKRNVGQGKGTRSLYKFHHFRLLVNLFNLPETTSEKDIRAEVSKALGELSLPAPEPRQKKERRPESIAASIFRSLEELVALTSSSTEVGLLLLEARGRSSLEDDVLEEIKRSF
jgi:hypothetical protein